VTKQAVDAELFCDALLRVACKPQYSDALRQALVDLVDLACQRPDAGEIILEAARGNLTVRETCVLLRRPRAIR